MLLRLHKCNIPPLVSRYRETQKTAMCSPPFPNPLLSTFNLSIISLFHWFHIAGDWQLSIENTCMEHVCGWVRLYLHCHYMDSKTLDRWRAPSGKCCLISYWRNLFTNAPVRICICTLESVKGFLFAMCFCIVEQKKPITNMSQTWVGVSGVRG